MYIYIDRYIDILCYSYAILFMADFKEKMLEISEKKPMTWWRYINDIFFIWEHGEESLRVFIDQVNLFHISIKFTAEYSKEKANFLDLDIKLTEGELNTDLFVNPTGTHQFLDPTYHCKKGYLTVKL